ncbi:hypothetical protein ZWY2020_057103 [Hordeum vulgare]|nr:hypothetical protein ZWY2020_057103 [Hordeum vulgare]
MPRLAPPLLTDVRRRSPSQRRRPLRRFLIPSGLQPRLAPPLLTDVRRRSLCRSAQPSGPTASSTGRGGSRTSRSAAGSTSAARTGTTSSGSTACPRPPRSSPLEARLERQRRASGGLEVLEMTLEKRTLVYHLTHFCRDFGLPNRLRALLVRHPELFYVSIKDVRHSAFLVEVFDDDRRLLVEDGMLVGRDRLEDIMFSYLFPQIFR